jgi:hypothetical protein
MTSISLLSQDPQSMKAEAGGTGGAEQTIDAYIKMISDGIDLVKKINDSLSQDARSIVIEIINFTSRELRMTTNNFEHGNFGPALPKGLVGPFSIEAFGVVSAGLLTGVEGSVNYSAEGAGEFLVGFNNPFAGSNAVNVNSNAAVDAQISIIGNISAGNHAHARFSVFDRTDPFPNRQHDWASCSRCQSLYFRPFGGVCPVGGQHDPSGSFNYFSIFNARPNSKVQASWHSCTKCQCLHFAGFPNAPGVCAAGGVHDDAGSFEYSVLFNADPAPERQNEWASCTKCRQLFFRPFGGSCPGGGSHDGLGSFNYAVDFTKT